ncbi:unnamed protein product [Meloidogyne enterolobii]|uniref:Uncharacterized protein n=2 Tax=Meloidogyne enterolobii TaxID=390850 RepID=A0ACB1AS03_MELEN|nr:unnamed protein product [Meloidogyne enterolobii]
MFYNPLFLHSNFYFTKSILQPQPCFYNLTFLQFIPFNNPNFSKIPTLFLKSNFVFLFQPCFYNPTFFYNFYNPTLKTLKISVKK